MSAEKAKLIHELDLLGALQNFNLKDKFLNGKLTCHWCNSPITKFENMSLLKKESGRILFCCSKLDCIYQSQHSKAK